MNHRFEHASWAQIDGTSPLEHGHVSVACLKTSCRLPIRICSVLREMATRSKSARITGTSCRLEPTSGATDRYQVPLELWPKFCGSPSAVPTIIRIFFKKELEIWDGARASTGQHLPESDVRQLNRKLRRSGVGNLRKIIPCVGSADPGQGTYVPHVCEFPQATYLLLRPAWHRGRGAAGSSPAGARREARTGSRWKLPAFQASPASVPSPHY